MKWAGVGEGRKDKGGGLAWQTKGRKCRVEEEEGSKGGGKIREIGVGVKGIESGEKIGITKDKGVK